MLIHCNIEIIDQYVKHALRPQDRFGLANSLQQGILLFEENMRLFLLLYY